jgi:ABC-type multidrug transport system fused ATPase/permease subunit
MLDLSEATPVVTGKAPAPDPAVEPIVFEQVSYAYPLRDGDVLTEVDLELRPGETVALVGASGAGKSTVVSLLLGFAQPRGGRILVGNVDLADVDPAAWRRRIAYVPQRPTLFHGTVADNIRLGDPGADDDAVRRAAELAGADDFVSALARGYDTLVGEAERQLSTGERRRIALARAFLRDAPLVLLDEPTADLDPARVALVSAAIERLRPGRTVLLVAHRPEVASQADRTVRLADGRVAPEMELA